MRKMLRFKAFLVTLTAGAFLPSCATDFRDAIQTGLSDAVSGEVQEAANSVIPLAEAIAAFLGA